MILKVVCANMKCGIVGKCALLIKVSARETKVKMTEKELKKLSRLELLEILLEESRENEKLRLELQEKSDENIMTQSIKDLSLMTDKMTCALQKADALTKDLEKIAKDGITVTAVATERREAISAQGVGVQSYPTPPKKEAAAVKQEDKAVVISDRNLYWRLMRYYSQNEMALAFLPPDIQNDIKARLRGILNGRK